MGKKADDLLKNAKTEVGKVDSKLEAYRKEAEAKLEATAKDTR